MWKAKKVHALLETFVFATIFLVCFFLILKTSTKNQIIDLVGSCSKSQKNGLLAYFKDKEKSDFSLFSRGSEEFNLRLFEHFLRPRVHSDFVVSPSLISVTLALLALASAESDLSEEIIGSVSLPCDYEGLTEDVNFLLNQFEQEFKLEAFVDVGYNSELFASKSPGNLSISQHADKFSAAVDKHQFDLQAYVQMETAFNQPKFALSSFLKFKSHENGLNSSSAASFPIFSSNVTILELEEDSSQIMILNSGQVSFIFCLPYSPLGFDLMQEKIEAFQIWPLPYKITFEGQAKIQVEKGHFLQGSLNLALPLQAFGSVSLFDLSSVFAQLALGSAEPLRVTQFWHNFHFDLPSVLKANFPVATAADDLKVVTLAQPYLFYVRSQGNPALIHVFGRVGQSGSQP